MRHSASPTPTERGVEARDDAVLHTLRWDPADGQGPERTFVLVHGLASNALLWTGVGRRLASAGHVVVAMDQRGHGRSSRPGRSFEPELLASDIIDVIDDHELDRPVLVGQSWGGNVVLDTALRHSRHVSAVVAVDGGVINLRAAFPDVGSAMDALHPPTLSGTPYGQIEAAIRDRHSDWPEEAIQAALANFDVRDDGTVEPRLRVEEHREILRTMWDQDPERWFADLTLPVLLLMVPSDGDEGWDATKSAQVKAAERAGADVSVRWLDTREHDIHAQAPDLVVLRVLNWLLEVSP